MKLILLVSLFASAAGRRFKYMDYVDLHAKIKKVLGSAVSFTVGSSVNENGDAVGTAFSGAEPQLAWLWNAVKGSLMELPVITSIVDSGLKAVEVSDRLANRPTGTQVLAVARDVGSVWPVAWHVELAKSKVIERRELNKAANVYYSSYHSVYVNRYGQIVFGCTDADGHLTDTVVYDFFADSLEFTNVPSGNTDYESLGFNNRGDIIAGKTHVAINNGDFTNMDLHEITPPADFSTEVVEIMSINDHGIALIRTHPSDNRDNGKLFRYDYLSKVYDTPNGYGLTGVYSAFDLDNDGKFIVETAGDEFFYTGSNTTFATLAEFSYRPCPEYYLPNGGVDYVTAWNTYGETAAAIIDSQGLFHAVLLLPAGSPTVEYRKACATHCAEQITCSCEKFLSGNECWMKQIVKRCDLQGRGPSFGKLIKEEFTAICG